MNTAYQLLVANSSVKLYKTLKLFLKEKWNSPQYVKTCWEGAEAGSPVGNPSAKKADSIAPRRTRLTLPEFVDASLNCDFLGLNFRFYYSRLLDKRQGYVGI